LSDGFEDYLKAQKKSNIRQILCIARKYFTVLQTGDATSLVNLSSTVTRRHAMEALSMLSKYSGCYNVWKDICSKYYNCAGVTLKKRTSDISPTTTYTGMEILMR
jgi:hypothetical protein